MTHAATLALLINASGCAAKPASQLETDALLFCRAWDDHGRPSKVASIADDVSARIKSTELLDAFAAIGPEGEGLAKVRAVVTKAGVKRCPTLDWLENRLHATEP